MRVAQQARTGSFGFACAFSRSVGLPLSNSIVDVTDATRT